MFTGGVCLQLCRLMGEREEVLGKVVQKETLVVFALFGCPVAKHAKHILQIDKIESDSCPPGLGLAITANLGHRFAESMS